MRVALETTLLHFTLETHCQQPHGSASSPNIYSKHFMTVRCVSKNYNVDIMSFSVGLCGLHYNITRCEKTGTLGIKVTFLPPELLSSYLHNSNCFLPKPHLRCTMGVSLLPKISSLRNHERLLSKIINTVVDVLWKAARLHSICSRRSSRLNISLSGLVLLYITLLLHLPKLLPKQIHGSAVSFLPKTTGYR